MIVVGAKGLASELLEIFFQRNELNNLFFFDNISQDLPAKLFNRFPILKSFQEVEKTFRSLDDFAFCLGLGNPVSRSQLSRQFADAGGVLTSVISPDAYIGHFGTILGKGSCILPGVVITNNAKLGEGCLVNPNASISHDAQLGNFVEVSPGVNITGGCYIGDYSMLGTNSVILPRLRVGKNAIVGAGAVVTKNVPDNCLVTGVPAVLRRKLQPLNF